ncbi:Rpn family recombination-promoting nuclease/putative transposase [Massilia pseudoviolaceinigra]|uniref:Rpn family recombination-promoting nuclease/putative transposase n=1 Tax=Massilia pseudoviolaceinigra TaxID=3057165 RepID=UPI002796CA23|nr:Rpn family recombination-promoting nuclease/putative transposase [Massilia sp. CCM 9206]MDQ1924103.1 Rpn family recombination-promoting nuclease/putative transposase [Massilia sp. CCM 9206]
MPAFNDLGYRSLFAHPELVRDLVTHFTPFKLFRNVALFSFERVDPVYVSERLAARQSDMVWRVRIGQHVLYVYILLEFQSGVDRWMALRMQSYVGLLCQDLVKRHALSSALLLPPVLPVVVYNGAPRWSASLDLAALLMQAPAELAPFQPSQRYLLIDQQRLDRAALEANATLLALLFRMELSSASEVRDNVLPALLTWFDDAPQESLRLSVAQWIKHLAQRRANPESFAFDSVEGVADMERKFETWAEEFEDIGFQKGLALAEKARMEGAAEGQVTALRAMLGSLLHKRFGALPQTATLRIGQATQADLEQWFERGLDAPSLAAVFGDDSEAARPA